MWRPDILQVPFSLLNLATLVLNLLLQLPDALAHSFSIEPVVSCLHRPLTDAYIETNDNTTNPPKATFARTFLLPLSSHPVSLALTFFLGSRCHWPRWFYFHWYFFWGLYRIWNQYSRLARLCCRCGCRCQRSLLVKVPSNKAVMGLLMHSTVC